MKCDFLILGGSGIQGKIITKYLLSKKYIVCVADIYNEVAELLKGHPKSCYEYINVENIIDTTKLIEKTKPSVVINCVEGEYNLHVYKSCLEAKTNVIDLGSDIGITIEQLRLDSEFKQRKIVAISGCGSTPGITNVMLKYAAKKLDKIFTIEAGFVWDSNIKKFVTPFSIGSVIYECLEQAPYFKNGKSKETKPFKKIIERKFRGVGKQKIFMVQHPETHTFYNFCKKKGIKGMSFYAGFPEHALSVIRSLIDVGFNEKEEKILLEDKEIAPIDILTQMTKKIPIPSGYREKENLWVAIQGQKNEKPRTILMECIVHTLSDWQEAGCNIDTGLPASIIAEMIKDKIITEKGSFTPEDIVPEKIFFEKINRFGMKIFENGKQLL